jgi:hypothetical protein
MSPFLFGKPEHVDKILAAYISSDREFFSRSINPAVPVARRHGTSSLLTEAEQKSNLFA